MRLTGKHGGDLKFSPKEQFNGSTETKILVDGGDPQETRWVKGLLGFVDGQTTNPTLIAKNPRIRGLIASGHKLSNKEEMDEYKKIVQTISPLGRRCGSVYRSIFGGEGDLAQNLYPS